MKDWVITYLKKVTPEISEALLDEIKRIDFLVFDEQEDVFFGEQHKQYDAYLDALVPLIGHFNCHFEPVTPFKCSNCQKFSWMFISVVADLSKDNFIKLSKAKNIFYIYSPASNAFTKDFDIKKMKIPMVGQADLKIVVFNHEIATFPWLLGRYCILRELGKIILASRDEDYVNKKITAWGFEKEVGHAVEFESTRRAAISTYYAL
jgi:hypothetical protein